MHVISKLDNKSINANMHVFHHSLNCTILEAGPITIQSLPQNLSSTWTAETNQLQPRYFFQEKDCPHSPGCSEHILWEVIAKSYPACIIIIITFLSWRWGRGWPPCFGQWSNPGWWCWRAGFTWRQRLLDFRLVNRPGFLWNWLGRLGLNREWLGSTRLAPTLCRRWSCWLFGSKPSWFTLRVTLHHFGLRVTLHHFGWSWGWFGSSCIFSPPAKKGSTHSSQVWTKEVHNYTAHACILKNNKYIYYITYITKACLPIEVGKSSECQVFPAFMHDHAWTCMTMNAWIKWKPTLLCRDQSSQVVHDRCQVCVLLGMQTQDLMTKPYLF